MLKTEGERFLSVGRYYLNDPNAPKPNSPTHIGTNVLLEWKGKLLLERRWDCGQWGLIGGRLKNSERYSQGISRELREETGYRTPALTPIGELATSPAILTEIIYMYLAENLEPRLIIALGKPAEEIHIVPVGEDGSTAYYRDENNVHYVPKRALEDIVIE